MTSIFERDGWRVTSGYGYRIHPITGEYGWHSGIDLAKEHRHPIPAWVGGKVRHAGWGNTGTGIGGYGYVVAIEDRQGHLHLYCHLDSVDVLAEAQVAAGQIIGRQGSTGISTASHLHYEIRTETSPSLGWKTDTDPGEYLDVMLAGEKEEEIDTAPAEWKISSLDYLVEQGLLMDADFWRTKIREPIPVWAVFILLERVHRIFDERLNKAADALKGGHN